MTVESKLLPGGGNMLVATGGGHVLAPPRNASPGYDANGNVTGDGLWNYTWDGENRLVGVETVSAVPETGQKKIAYAYDFEGRRIQTTRYTKSGANWVADPTGPTVMLYDGWNLIAERNSTADKKYLWGLDLSGTLGQAGGVGGLLAIHNAGQTDSVAYDANGNVAALVNASSGTLDGSYEYGPFGEPLAVTGPMAEVNPFRFSTKYTDNESGLIYYPPPMPKRGRPSISGRFYQPLTGSWLSRDRMGERGGLNLYGFCLNNPISNIDPFGTAVKSIKVEYSSAKPTHPLIPSGGYNNPTGRIYEGTLSANTDSGVKSWGAKSGGYRTDSSAVRGPSASNPSGDDAVTPAGNWTVSTRQNDYGLKGFTINVGFRNAILITLVQDTELKS